MTPEFRLWPRRPVALAVAALGLLLCNTAHAQLTLTPAAPQNLTPSGGTLRADAPAGVTIVLTWVQPLFAGLTVRPTATLFRICLLPTAPGVAAPACTASNATWTELIASPTAALTRVGNTFTFRPGRIYSASELDVPLRIAVVACSNYFSCTPATADVWLSTRDIELSSIGDGTEPNGDWRITARANNPGTTPIERFTGEIAYWEVLVTGTQGRTCLTNADSADIRDDATLWVIDDRGVTTRMPQVPRSNGIYVGRPIVGIYRTGSAYDLRTFTTTAPALPAGARDRGVAVVTFPVAQAGSTRAFAVYARLDGADVVREYDESNNQGARCLVR